MVCRLSDVMVRKCATTVDESRLIVNNLRVQTRKTCKTQAEGFPPTSCSANSYAVTLFANSKHRIRQAVIACPSRKRLQTLLQQNEPSEPCSNLSGILVNRTSTTAGTLVAFKFDFRMC